MKLAEALKLRADLKTRLGQIEYRLNNNAKVQEGEEPSEDPIALLGEMNRISEQLIDLVYRINKTNVETVSKDGESLASLIAKREVMIKKASIMRSFLNEASSLVNRHAATEIKIVSTVDVKELRRTCDSFAEQARLIDNTIQELNWTTELI